MDPRTEPEPAAEPTTTIQEAATTAPEAPEEEPATYDAAYVRKLRSEAATRRREVKEAEERLTAKEAELDELRAWRLERSIVDANVPPMGMPQLADPSDLLAYTDAAILVDDAGKADPERIKAAIAALLERKPHLRAGYGRQGGAWGGSEGGTNTVPPPSLGTLVGRAARGESER